MKYPSAVIGYELIGDWHEYRIEWREGSYTSYIFKPSRMYFGVFHPHVKVEQDYLQCEPKSLRTAMADITEALHDLLMARK